VDAFKGLFGWGLYYRHIDKNLSLRFLLWYFANTKPKIAANKAKVRQASNGDNASHKDQDNTPHSFRDKTIDCEATITHIEASTIFVSLVFVVAICVVCCVCVNTNVPRIYRKIK